MGNQLIQEKLQTRFPADDQRSFFEFQSSSNYSLCFSHNGFRRHLFGDNGGPAGQPRRRQNREWFQSFFRLVREEHPQVAKAVQRFGFDPFFVKRLNTFLGVLRRHCLLWELEAADKGSSGQTDPASHEAKRVTLARKGEGISQGLREALSVRWKEETVLANALNQPRQKAPFLFEFEPTLPALKTANSNEWTRANGDRKSLETNQFGSDSWKDQERAVRARKGKKVMSSTMLTYQVPTATLSRNLAKHNLIVSKLKRSD